MNTNTEPLEWAEQQKIEAMNSNEMRDFINSVVDEYFFFILLFLIFL